MKEEPSEFTSTEIKTNPNRNRELTPPQLKDPDVRHELAQQITDWIELGQNQKGQLPARWRKNEQNYRGQPDEEYGFRASENSEPQAFNIVKPAVNALVTKVCQPLTSNRPYFSAMGYQSDRERLKTNEDVVQFCYEIGGFPKKLRTITRAACMAAPMFWQASFVEEYDDVLAGMSSDTLNMSQPYRYVGPSYEIIHPNDFVIYPLMDINKARVVGRRHWLRLAEIREMQKTGAFFDTKTLYGNDHPQSWESGRDAEWSLTNEDSGNEGIEDDKVAFWEVLVKLDLNGDGFEERYRAVVLETQKELLDCEFYGYKMKDENGDEEGELIPYSRVWFFPHFVESPGYDEIFHANPPTQDLQPYQGWYSDLLSVAMEGAKQMALPSGFIKGGSLDAKVIRYSWGEYHYIPAGVEIEHIKAPIDLAVIPLLLNAIKEDRDALLRISQNATAQVQGDSATEAAILQSNMEEGAEEYRDNVAMSGEEMADFTRELCYVHYDVMKDAHGDSFPCENRDDLKNPLRWEASGKTSDTNPQLVAQNFKEIWEIAKDPTLGPMLGLNIKGMAKAWIKTKKLPIAESDIFLEQETMGQPGAGGPNDLGGLVDRLANADLSAVSGGAAPDASNGAVPAAKPPGPGAGQAPY